MQDNGADVEAGKPYVEVEAMKMIMPIKASESGKITHNLSPGTVISAGESLTLKDPSKVKKILNFDGDFDIDMDAFNFDSKDAVNNILAGYSGDVEATAVTAIDSATDVDTATDIVLGAVDEFVRVESMFDGKLRDDVVRTMAKDNINDLDQVINLNQAHQQLSTRSALMLSIIRQVETFEDRFGAGSVPTRLYAGIEKLSFRSTFKMREATSIIIKIIVLSILIINR